MLPLTLMKNNILKIRFGILDKTRQELLEKLFPYTKGFTLGGGTALALQIKHRKSFDFDFFSSSPIPSRLLESLGKALEIANVSVDTADELTFFTKDGVKVSFLHYPFRAHFPEQTLENGLRVFSASEIALQKAYAIGRRGEYRDYFDLCAILKKGLIDFSELIFWAKKTYRSAFEEKLFLEQLVYFDDLLNFDIVPVGKNLVAKQEEVKKFFEKKIKERL